MLGNSRCIMIVDDERSILCALERELHDWAAERSLEIVLLQSARQGLEMLETRGDDAVLLISDLKMPEMGGPDFLIEVKRKYPEIISILLTGFPETGEVIKAVQAGIFSYILKPWDYDYLIAEVTKAYDFAELRRLNSDYTRLIEDELKWAGEMKRAILRPSIPPTDRVDFRVSHRTVPGVYCGGDYYDTISLGKDRYLLMIGEVEGHGVKAAFVTGILKAIIYPDYVRAMIGKEISPGAFLGWLNGRLNFEFRRSARMSIGLFVGMLDLNAAAFRYSNAGHCRPIIVKGGKSFELGVQGSAIGSAYPLAFSEETTGVGSGDVIVLYTDGLVEMSSSAQNASLKIGPILAGLGYSVDYHRRILEAAMAERSSRHFTDDVTILSAMIG